MKFFLLLLATLLISGPSQAQELRLGTKDNHFQTSDGKPFAPRGVSLCSLEWHQPLKQIEDVTSSPERWNVNILRLPVQPQEWNRVGANNYIKTYLDPAVRLCRQKNMQCIIDWHAIAPWNDPKQAKMLEDFWERVAPRYAADRNIVYEIFNEPTDPTAKTAENWKAWKDTAQKWVDDIRQVAPHTLLLIGSPHWSQMPAFAAEDPFRGKNLAYVMHLYPNYQPGSWDKAFGNAAEKVPVILTEWGWSVKEASEREPNNPIYGTQKDFGEPLKAYLDERPHIGWTAWSYDPLCAPAMLGADKEMGRFVKDWLAEPAAANPDKHIAR